MKATADHGYPYPECNPPFVEDTADLPAQLKALAEAVDDDVDAINIAANAALNPPAALLSLTGTETLGPTAYLKFNNLTTVLDNVGGLADGPNSRLVAPSPGLYLVTGTAISSSAPDTLHQLGLRLNGALFRAESIRPSTAAGVQIRNNVFSLVFMTTGDVVDMVQYQPGAGNVTYQQALLGAYRVLAT